MARDRGQLIQRGEEKYLIRVYLGRQDGKRKYKSKTVYGDEDHAEKKLTEMLRLKDQGHLRRQSDKTLGDLADEWLKNKKGKVQPATYDSYERYVRVHIKPGLGYAKLEDVNARLVQGFVNELDQEKGLSARYVRQIHTCLQMILKKAVAWDYIPLNPAGTERIDLPRVQRRERRTLDRNDIGALLEAAEGNRLYALFVLLVTTGLRPQEAYGLRWDDLDEDGFLNVRRVVSTAPEEDERPWRISEQMKTRSSRRRIKLSDTTLEALEEHKAKQAKEILAAGSYHARDGFIFTRGPKSDDHSRFIYQEYARRHFQEVLEKAGLPTDEINLYTLRHTHISRLILDGVDLKEGLQPGGTQLHPADCRHLRASHRRSRGADG